MDINKTYNPMPLFTFFPEVPLPPNHPYLTALILFLRSNPNVTSCLWLGFDSLLPLSADTVMTLPY